MTHCLRLTVQFWITPLYIEEILELEYNLGNFTKTLYEKDEYIFDNKDKIDNNLRVTIENLKEVEHLRDDLVKNKHFNIIVLYRSIFRLTHIWYHILEDIHDLSLHSSIYDSKNTANIYQRHILDLKRLTPFLAMEIVQLIKMYSIPIKSLLNGKLLHHTMAKWSDEEFLHLVKDIYAKDADDEVLLWLKEGENFLSDRKHLKEITSMKAAVYLKKKLYRQAVDIFEILLKNEPDSRSFRTSLDYATIKAKENKNEFLDTEEEQSSYSSVDEKERKLCNGEIYKEPTGDLQSFTLANTAIKATQIHKRLVIIDNALDKTILNIVSTQANQTINKGVLTTEEARLKFPLLSKQYPFRNMTKLFKSLAYRDEWAEDYIHVSFVQPEYGRIIMWRGKNTVIKHCPGVCGSNIGKY
ncbi:DgyrCDS8129 [Dimorphilus gyrociliatus]|uniref:DgyrCDS8129 n=1 Tax=Dimorphilus gyrociliatus TaxID=2664684 RepID=A0A7I8VVJ1_9ANNE|nr:DgyrCDS8129 [Dimorphilus gyrociliatus]